MQAHLLQRERVLAFKLQLLAVRARDVGDLRRRESARELQRLLPVQ